jgi:hypothetical protein
MRAISPSHFLGLISSRLVALCLFIIVVSIFGGLSRSSLTLFALLFTTRPSVISPLILYALAISSCAHICRPERERPSCPRNQNIYDIYYGVCATWFLLRSRLGQVICLRLRPISRPIILQLGGLCICLSMHQFTTPTICYVDISAGPNVCRKM